MTKTERKNIERAVRALERADAAIARLTTDEWRIRVLVDSTLAGQADRPTTIAGLGHGCLDAADRLRYALEWEDS